MNTFQLTCFLTVTETLSFAKAAKLLNVTQPTITHQIHSLEEELNTQLFRRTTRSVEITQEGLIFLNDAKNVLNIITLAKKRFEEPVTDERQFFSIGCHSHDELHLLPGILRQMADSCPMLHPVFQVVPFQHLYQLLDEETVDVVIAFQEKDQKKISGIYKELAQVNVLAAMAPEHPLAQKAELTKQDLETERLILAEPQRCPDSLNAVQQELAAGRAVSKLFMCNSADACMTLAKAGFGITVMPNLPISKNPGLVYIPIQGTSLLSYGAYYKTAAGKPLLRQFLQLCKEFFSNIE